MIRNTHVVMLTSALRMVPLSTQLVVSGSRKCPSYLAVPGLFPKDPKKNEQFSEGALPAVTDSFKAVVNRPDSTPDTVKVLSDSTCENSGTLNGFKFVVRSHPKTKQTINLEFIISARDVGVFQRLKLLENPTKRDCISAIILWWSIGMLKDVTLVYIYIYTCASRDPPWIWWASPRKKSQGWMMDRRTYRETALQPFKASVGIRETLLQSNCGSTSLKSHHLRRVVLTQERNRNQT